jgi:ATP-dependent helicase/nuclease subunit B
MNNQNHNIDEHLTQLSADSVLLTPNRRLAVVLHDHYITLQQQKKLQCWQKPNILSIKAWLESLWRSHLNTTTKPVPHLLNNAQARALWETIVSGDSTHNLLQVGETAEALKSAWELIHQYEVDVNDSQFQLTDDYALCQRWLRQYQTICEQHNYIDSAVLPNFLAREIAAGEIKLPKKMLLYGFTEVIPQYEKLVSSHGLDLAADPGFRRERNDKTLTLPDLDSEIIAMARFAKATHDAHPEASIGCVVLDLNQRRDRVLQLFTQVFFPEQPFDIDAMQYPFNISAGKSLASYPIIAAALLITGLSTNTMTREDFSNLLLSPYIGEAERESAERAKLDAELRRKNVHLVRVYALSEVSHYCPLLAKRLMDPAAKPRNKKISFHDWAQHFNNMLSAFGWPGEKSLASEEYQVANAWLTALADFASLDEIAAPATHKEAWQHLKQVLTAHVFQPQSPKTNIQVLGLLEAAAVPFDYLWVAGMNDTSWPPQPNPHPFIPKPLQRQLNMPHSTAERELHFCTTLLNQFQQAVLNIIFSHAESDGKIEFKSSSLLQSFPTTTLSALPQSPYTAPANLIFSSKQSESFSDGCATPLTMLQKLTGGADIIKQQAACAFRAFATHRLQARELETSTQGLSPKDRGIILHNAMQQLWNEIYTQEKLLAMDDAALESLINHCIDDAITNNAPQHHHDTYYISLEKKRLAKMIAQWLALEKSRPPFFVSTNEQSAILTLHDRELSLRIDRIDTLMDGSKLIIDYKSGMNNSVNKWYGDQPDEPQLPLYALIDPENTTGISFAQLAAGNIRFKGISRTPLNIDGIETEAESWPGQLVKWRAIIEKLAADFIAGEARVNPKRPSDTCKNCALTPLCRIHEISDPTDETDTSEEIAYE